MTSADDLELTILMPCLNEEVTLGDCIDAANTYLSRTTTRGEVLVAGREAVGLVVDHRLQIILAHFAVGEGVPGRTVKLCQAPCELRHELM